jgi:hypothetical protein
MLLRLLHRFHPTPPRKSPRPPTCLLPPIAAEYFVEGMMRRLLDRHDPTSRKLLQSCVFYVVPCM